MKIEDANVFLPKKIVSLFLLSLLFRLDVFSQTITQVSHYSTAEGLSDNRITEIIRDKEGFMWFGSWAGISRFDGHRFVTFKSYPGDRSSLKSNRIDQIVEDSQGENLWLKAYDKRIYRFDKRTQQIRSLSEILNKKHLSKLEFSKILLAEGQEVWLQSNAGIFLINCQGNTISYTLFAEKAEVQRRLPSNNINFLYSDDSGNKWVGTKQGVVLLRRSKGGQYLPESTGLYGSVNSIAELGSNMWIIDSVGRLISVSKNLKTIKPSKPSLSFANHVMVSKNKSVLYCTTTAGELYRISPGRDAELLMKVNDGSAMSQVYEDLSGVLWVRSAHFGVIRFDPESRSSQYLFPKKKYLFSLPLANYPIFEDKNSGVWITLDRHLYRYVDRKQGVETLASQVGQRYELSSQNITQIFYDPSGVLWVAGGYDGVNKIIFREQEFVKDLLVPQASLHEENDVRGLLTDKHDRLWIGTKAGRLFLHDQGILGTDVLRGKFANEAGIYTILEDAKGSIWLGTKANGLVKLRTRGASVGDTSVFQYTPNEQDLGAISGKSIYCLLEDRTGRLWAGAYDEGLILIAEDGKGSKFKTLKNSFKNYPREGFRKIRHIAEDANGLIWLGTTDGLLVFDPNDGSPDSYKFRSYSKKPGDIHSLGGNDVQFIYRDSNNDMWVLTTTGGLNLASRTNPLEALSFTNYSVRDGLPSDYLLSCVEDNRKNLWIGTQNGLSKFSILTKKIQNFDGNDGLQKVVFSEASVLKMRSGKIVFGTASGLLSFDPQHIRTSKISANMALTAFQVNSQEIFPAEGSPLKYSINNTKQIHLEHDQNVISIDFTVLDFHADGRNGYAYRLVGFDNVWRSSEGQRRATYTKLPPGSYVFEVKCLNDELYLNTPSRSLRIIISPPFWKTWWAYSIYAVLFMFAAIVVRKGIITVLKLRQEIEVEKRVADLKLNFFTQISHELRTPLTLIVSPSEEIEKHENLTVKGREYINVVLRNAHRMLRLVNQVLDLRKVQSGKATLQSENVEIIGLIKVVVEYFRETLEQREINIMIQSSNQELTSCIDREKIEIVLYNLVGNAIKFSNDSSDIYISLSKSDDSAYFTVEVKDEGPGIDDSELDNIFQMYHEGKHNNEKQVKGTGIGLALSKELVELHGGKIYALNNKPVGLTVRVELPFVDVRTDEIKLSMPGEPLPSILIAEDNAELLSFLATKFGTLYQVMTADNGLVAFDKAKTNLPDLILSDVMMPKMDGIQLLDRIKNDELTSHIPVILLTARSSVESQVKALAHGADYYLTKPVSIELLEVAVQTIIARRKTLFNAFLQESDTVIKPENPVRTSQQDQQTVEPEIYMTDFDKKFLERVLAIVEVKIADSQFNIDEIVESLNMSRSTFYRKLKSLTNFTPVEFVREVRLKKVRELLDSGEDNVSTAAYAAGFSNPKYMSSCFKTRYNENPSDYVKRVRHGR